MWPWCWPGAYQAGDPVPVAGTAGKSATMFPFEPEPSQTLQADFTETVRGGTASLTSLATPKDEETS